MTSLELAFLREIREYVSRIFFVVNKIDLVTTRRALQNRNEEDAYRLTIIRIVGDRNVCMPWAADGEI
jgi:hypothetical protein